MKINLRMAALLTLAGGLLSMVPMTFGVSKAAEGEKPVLSSLQCAAVYFVATKSYSDPNYLAMVKRYYMDSDHIYSAKAKEQSEAMGLKFYRAWQDGTLDADTPLASAKYCSKTYQIDLPVLDEAVVNHKPPPRVAASSSQLTSQGGASSAEAACSNASERYRTILHAMPGRLSAVGPRQTKECDRPGPLCDMPRPNSKWYYEMGQICSSLKPVEEDIRRYCGENIAKLDDC
ncbi:MAG: hypothetical protein ACKOUT_07395 [Novosphingobium sp.]